VKKFRPIAIHLPQFHQIPENDKWWGEGFTEWTNVRKAKPLFKGHFQPHIPLDKNYYDLSSPDILEKQANMAQAYGIHGFCYYHYWFNGKKLLEKPLENMLKKGVPNFPFMLCWANENWTRTWDGRENNILMKQEYSFDDDKEHFRYLLPFFKDKRYIKVKNKPVFVVYRSELFPDISKTLSIWREESTKLGLDGLYLIKVERFTAGRPPEEGGFDASMEFHPDFALYRMCKRKSKNVLVKALNKLNIVKDPVLRNRVFDYNDYVANAMQRQSVEYKQYPTIMPSWDNSPRKQEKATILLNATPEKYLQWFAHLTENHQPFSPEEDFIFINAWNEWGEGNYLEPSEQWGTSYLEATKQALESIR
jgi:lipopolysaccharide biosynthesis protein